MALSKENSMSLVLIFLAVFGFMTGWFVHESYGEYQCKVELNKWGQVQQYVFPLSNFTENMDRIHEENLLNKKRNLGDSNLLHVLHTTQGDAIRDLSYNI